MENIIKALERDNKWWKGKFELDFKPREIYKRIKILPFYDYLLKN